MNEYVPRVGVSDMKAMRIAIADDDEAARLLLMDMIGQWGHVCSPFKNGRDLITALQRDTFDLLIIDWTMPEPDGLEVIRWARANLKPCPPMIMLTNRADKDDVVAGLDLGADDYIVKPEQSHVILARINAVLRRSVRTTEGESQFERFGIYMFDKLREVVMFHGEEIKLTAKEFALARLLFTNAHRALSRAYIMERLWNSAADLHTRTLDMHISRVRSKLQLRPENGYRLLPIFSYGYRLETFEENEG
jgi:DNA-binding response OmpR family regulator